MAELLVAGNQGIRGIFAKLTAMGLPVAAPLSRNASKLYGVTLLMVAARIGLRRDASRSARAIAWIGLLGLASLASTGAWADYVPLTCVWLLTLLAPLACGRPAIQLALIVCAVLQLFLPGTMPLGDWVGTSWMYPLSPPGALAMLATFATGVAIRARRPYTQDSRINVKVARQHGSIHPPIHR